MNEPIRLSIMFFEHVKKVDKTSSGKLNVKDNYKEVILRELIEMINFGIEPSTIEEAIMKASEIKDTYYKLEDVFEELGYAYGVKEYVQDPTNLLELGSFYYHHDLQIVPPPPKIRIDDDGNFIQVNEQEFFLELKTYYSLDDLLDYFYKKHRSANPKYKKRDRGAMDYLLGLYDLDLILFTIDTSYFIAIDKGKKNITNPLQMQEYFEDAEEVLEQKKNSAKREGLNRVIPRKSTVL